MPKADANLDNVILNPLKIPAYPPLFSFNRTTGYINVNVANCVEAQVQADLANNTVDILNLNSSRLATLRREELNYINESLHNLVLAGMSIEDARMHLVNALMQKNKSKQWPKFFTAIRVYLGGAAENHLRANAYDG